jgi:hypothetical protein
MGGRVKNMNSTLATRKPIEDITIEDLKHFPIWEFALDESNEDQDETFIRPIDSKVVPLNNYSMSVHTYFTTASGMEIQGLIEVSTDDGIELGHGVLLFDNNYIFVPYNNFDDCEDEYKEIANILGLNYEDTFPLSFKLSIPIEGNAELIEGKFST